MERTFFRLPYWRNLHLSSPEVGMALSSSFTIQVRKPALQTALPQGHMHSTYLFCVKIRGIKPQHGRSMFGDARV